MKEIVLIGEKKLIGCGGVSKVYECIIDNISSELVILKVGCDVKKNSKNFQLVKSLGLPTLKFVKEELFERKPVLITEHLNKKSEIIYVTPNSVISDDMKLLQKLDTFNKSSQEKFESVAEQFRYQNKLSEILNFEAFLYATIIDLKKASNFKVVIDFDSYFIGSVKNETKSNINYIIADLDHIEKHNRASFENCFKENKSELKRAMTTFVKHFVNEGVNKEKYQKLISKI